MSDYLGHDSRNILTGSNPKVRWLAKQNSSMWREGKGSGLAIQKPHSPTPEVPYTAINSTKWWVFGNFPE
jgi:hypothetical protein